MRELVVIPALSIPLRRVVMSCTARNKSAYRVRRCTGLKRFEPLDIIIAIAAVNKYVVTGNLRGKSALAVSGGWSEADIWGGDFGNVSAVRNGAKRFFLKREIRSTKVSHVQAQGFRAAGFVSIVPRVVILYLARKKHFIGCTGKQDTVTDDRFKMDNLAHL